MIKFHKYFIVLICLAYFTFSACENNFHSIQKTKTSFAIVIDQKTYNNVEVSLMAYKEMLEKEGLNVVILKEGWKNADDIRNKLKVLYNSKPQLEGAVFIGDVPIPFIMNAQHLTTAYKRNQEKYPLHIAAVPSDRFYDDFDLKFEFIEKDSIISNYYYYNLSPSSPQYVQSDIYTGRIKPSIQENDDKYELIREYLDKVVALRNKTKLDFLMSFTGHGYNSQDLNAWLGEKIALREQFPELYTTKGKIEFLEFRMSQFMKPFLLDRFQDPDLDIALLHEHGTPELQLINGTQATTNVDKSIENIKIYLRSKLRSAKNRGKSLSETKQRYVRQLGVPESWFDGTFDKETEEKDSLYEYNMDIYLNDIREIQPEAKFIMFDACFNGSFHKEKYIAGEYVFGNGSTIVAHANTVNALQDKWPNEMLGLLGKGVRVGNWARQINTLETHLIGDPTYYFKSHQEIDYNKLIAAGNKNKKVWNDLLKVDNPELQCLALNNLFEPGNQSFSSQLKEIYMTSPYFVVRMACLKQLNKYNNNEFTEVLKMAVTDPYELIRRKAVTMIGKKGDNELINPLLTTILNDRYSGRVRYNAYGSLEFMDPDEVKKELVEVAQKYGYMSNSSALKDQLYKRIEWKKQKIREEFDYIRSDSSVYRYKMINIRTLRNYNYHYMIPDYITLLDDPGIDEALKITLIEALGWFVNSVNKELIIQKCAEITSSKNLSREIRTEALRTINRLEVYK